MCTPFRQVNVPLGEHVSQFGNPWASGIDAFSFTSGAVA